MRKNDLRRTEARWARRNLFGERRRRRLPWRSIALLLLIGAGLYALTHWDLVGGAQRLWAQAPAPPSTPRTTVDSERLSILPLPPEPPGSR